MTVKLSKQAKDLEPFIVEIVRKAMGGKSISAASGVAGVSLARHALNDASIHTGTLADGQAPQFLKRDGSRALTGDLPVAPGVTIDGVDLSAHVANPDAHHKRASSGPGVNVSPTQQVSVVLRANPGLAVDGTGLTMGAPRTLSVSSASERVGADHWHAIETASHVGEFPARKILASTTEGRIELKTLGLWGDLNFTAADRSIYASHNLTLAPDVNLVFWPNGLVILPDQQEMRTPTFNDLPTGIDGFRLWTRGEFYRQLTIGAIKADELFVRVFTADEVRIDRGEEYWSKSYGIVQEDFTLPLLGESVDVWFEDAPALASANLFSVGDWLLARTIDWDTGLVVQKVWFQVQNVLPNGYVAKDTLADGMSRQQWRLRRVAGGFDGMTIKAGNTFLDAGQQGQGWIHLSALQQDGGPFIQVGKMTGPDPTVGGAFTNFFRMGNLNGTAGYQADAYGIVAGKNIGQAVGSGFEGITVDGEQGVRFYNTDARLFLGNTEVGIWTQDRFVLRASDGVTPILSIYLGEQSLAHGALTLANGDVAIGHPDVHYLHFRRATGRITLQGDIFITGGNGIGNFSDAGALATKHSVNLATNEVTNKSLANLDADANGRLYSIQPGATVGANWETNLSNIPVRFGENPGAKGLYLTPDRLGYWTGSAWRTFMNKDGQFYFAGEAGATIYWDGASLRGRNASGQTQWYADSTDGRFYAGAGAVRLDNQGVNLRSGTAAGFNPSSITWHNASGIDMGYIGIGWGSSRAVLSLSAVPQVSGDAHADVYIDAIARGAGLGRVFVNGLHQIRLLSNNPIQLVGGVAVSNGNMTINGSITADVNGHFKGSTFTIGRNTVGPWPVTINHPSQPVVHLQAAGVERAFFGATGNANQFFVGTSAGDAFLRSERQLWVGTIADSTLHLLTSGTPRISISGGGVITLNGRFTGWSNLSFISGWGNFGSGYRGGQHRQIGDIIFLRGLVRRVSGDSLDIAKLPYSFGARHVFSVDANGDGRVDILTDGTIRLVRGNTNYVSLDGIIISTL